MRKRIYLYVLLTFLCGFAINLQAAVVSLGTEDTPQPKANFVEKTEAGDLSLMGEIVMKSTHCPTGRKSCSGGQIGDLVDGYSACYSKCYCPEGLVKIDNIEDLAPNCESQVCTEDDGAKFTTLECLIPECPAGQSAEPGGDCEKCPEGTYKEGTNRDKCTACSEGTYNTGTGNRYASSCNNCTQNHYCPGDVVENIPAGEEPGTRIPCPAGTYNDKPKGKSIAACIPCGECRFSKAGGYCQLCYYGIISEDNSSCKKSSSDISCPAGYEYTTGSLSGCQTHATTAVTSANYCNASGVISTNAQFCKTCTKCNNGYELKEGKCELCTNSANVASWSSGCTIGSCNNGWVKSNNTCTTKKPCGDGYSLVENGCAPGHDAVDQGDKHGNDICYRCIKASCPSGYYTGVSRCEYGKYLAINGTLDGEPCVQCRYCEYPDAPSDCKTTRWFDNCRYYKTEYAYVPSSIDDKACENDKKYTCYTGCIECNEGYGFQSGQCAPVQCPSGSSTSKPECNKYDGYGVAEAGKSGASTCYMCEKRGVYYRYSGSYGCSNQVNGENACTTAYSEEACKSKYYVYITKVEKRNIYDNNLTKEEWGHGVYGWVSKSAGGELTNAECKSALSNISSIMNTHNPKAILNQNYCLYDYRYNNTDWIGAGHLSQSVKCDDNFREM